MRRPRTVLTAALLGLMAPFLVATPASAEPVTVPNGVPFTDTDGNSLHAHGGGVLQEGDYYYWIGENRGPDNNQFEYVSMYRSTNLRDWEFRNHILTQDSDPELDVANIERPKVIHNERTGQYVMWAHKENGINYSEARVGVAVSDTIDGDYEWLGSFRPLGHESRDQTVHVDDDGTGYLVSAARNNFDLHIYRLTPDYTDVEELVSNNWPGAHREAPAMFQRNGVYFLATSGASGWAPNQQQYATADCVECEWSDWTNLGNATGYDSQTTFVLPVEGSETTSYLYMGDRWGNNQGGLVNDSQYVWAPLEFPTDRSLRMDYFPELLVDTATGEVSGVGGPYGQLAAGHSGKCLDVVNGSRAAGAELIQYDCHSGMNQQWSVEEVGDGHVQLRAQHSGHCVDIAGKSTATNARAVQAPCDGTPSQQWQANDVGGGQVELVARHSGLCLDVADESTANSTRLIQWTCTGGANQRWQHRV